MTSRTPQAPVALRTASSLVAASDDVFGTHRFAMLLPRREVSDLGCGPTVVGRDNARTPLKGKAGAVLRLFAPRNVWTGTLGAAQNAVILATGPIKQGRLSSVCVEVQSHSGNMTSPDDPESRRRAAQARPARCLTSFSRPTFFYDYGPFGSSVIGPSARNCTFLGIQGHHRRVADVEASKPSEASRCRPARYPVTRLGH